MLSLLTQSNVMESHNKYEISQFVEGNFLEVTNLTKPSVIKILATSVKEDICYISFRQYSIGIDFKGEYLKYGGKNGQNDHLRSEQKDHLLAGAN